MTRGSHSHSRRPGRGDSEAVTITAKSREQALVKAAGALGVTQSELGYEVLREETAKGLFSFFKSSVCEIKAWAKPAQREHGGRDSRSRRSDDSRRGHRKSRNRHDESYDERRSSRPRRPAAEDYDDVGVRSGDQEKVEPLSAEAVAALRKELQEFSAGVCARIAGEDVDVSTREDDGRLVVDVKNDYIADQISKNSKLAEALEHILRKKPRHLRQELPFRIFVDVSGVRQQREEELIQMAHDLSAKVHENKRPIVLNYKSSYDRKIIHMALDKDERVYTKSIGSGPNRKLMILPVRDQSSKGTQQEVDEYDDEALQAATIYDGDSDGDSRRE